MLKRTLSPVLGQDLEDLKKVKIYIDYIKNKYYIIFESLTKIINQGYKMHSNTVTVKWHDEEIEVEIEYEVTDGGSPGGQYEAPSGMEIQTKSITIEGIEFDPDRIKGAFLWDIEDEACQQHDFTPEYDYDAYMDRMEAKNEAYWDGQY
jgi:hypothetical protein